MSRAPKYLLVEGPRHVLNQAGSELPGHYEVVFASQGKRFERFLTDKGYAELLRLIDAGQRSFTRVELESLSTPPSMDDLLATMQAESGEGA